MDFSVVICTYNRVSSLGKTLESLSQMSVPSDLKWEVLVIDNNSTDTTRQQVATFIERSRLNMRYIFEPRTGKSFALNTGIAEAKGHIVAFTDDDVQVTAEWLQELAVTFREFDCIGVGGRSIPVWNGLRRPDWLVTVGPHRLSSGPILDFDFGDEAEPLPVSPWGLNMAFRRLAFEKYGLFRTDLGPSGSRRILAEDTEFGRRLIRSGEKIIYSPKAAVFHPVGRERITRKYFLSAYFNLGRAEIREEGCPSEAVLWFGVPRFMFRSLIASSAHWLFSFNARQRFYHKAQVHRSLGQIV